MNRNVSQDFRAAFFLTTCRCRICFSWILPLLLFLPTVVRAQFTFITNNGAITITGYTGTGGEVTIPTTTNGYPVTSIGNSAFYGYSSVTNVTIPNTVTNIDVQAFTGCGLTSITIPDSVTSIRQSAFLECYSLVSLTIGNSVISIEDYAFGDCSSLTNVFIPKSVTNINATAFNECSDLTAIMADGQNPVYSSVAGVLFNNTQTKLLRYPCGITEGSYSIPENVTLIGDYAFSFCYNLTNVIIPNTVTNIGPEAFAYCNNLTNFITPTNVINIEASAFSGCASLTIIVIPPSVRSIGSGAFSGTGITSILIPNSVTNIGPQAFAYCSSLTNIEVATDNPAYSSVAGVLFDTSKITLVEFPFGQSGGYFRPGRYVIPNGITSIGVGAFASCPLANITIPSSVTSIGSEAFYECTRLANLTIPDSVINIGNGAFEASSLTNLTIPASVTTLGWFGGCPSLRSVYFKGNAPGQGSGIAPISFFQNATAYYLPGTTGWGAYFQTTELPTALWLPQIQTSSSSFGVRTNQFGFNIAWANGMEIVVESSTTLANSIWFPLQTNTLSGDTFFFSDPAWTNYPTRFYRIRSP